jgi:hypothetical protein
MSSTGQGQIQAQLNVSGELTQTLLAVMNTLAGKALGTQPVDSKGNPKGQVLYMQMRTGLPIDATDFETPWSPIGGDSTAQQASGQPAAPSPSGSAAPTMDATLAHSMQTAFNTAELVDELFMVTGSGQLQTYPTSRSLSFQYDQIIKGMQSSTPQEAPDPKVVAEVTAAQELLYVFDSNGNNTGQLTPLYQNYQNNTLALAEARANMAMGQAEALSNPAMGQVWPQLSATYEQQIQQAEDVLDAQGAGQVEEALGVIDSQGVNVVDSLIAQAKQLFDAWDVDATGVGVSVPFSMIFPGDWWDSTNTQNGFTKISATSSDWTQLGSQAQGSWAGSYYGSQSQSTSASGDASFLGISIGGSGSSANQSGGGSGEGKQYAFQSSGEQMTNVKIEMEYGLARVTRPWLVSDLFHIGGWYLLGAKKNSISDGTIKGQVDNTQQLMPMIPTAFLVLRNVSITASNWGQAGVELQKAAQAQSSGYQGSSSSGGGSVGFLCFGASASHDEQQASNWERASSASSLNFKFTGSSLQGTLAIEGEQIVGWIGEIVPACPASDDPELAKTPKPTAAAPSTTPAPSAAPAGSGPPTPTMPTMPPEPTMAPPTVTPPPANP